jgi:Transcriptional regulator, AbiEi antitoxin/Protein of unknown function (DUF559)
LQALPGYDRPTLQRSGGRVWSLVRSQHGVVTRNQLLAIGVSRHAIAHRLAEGRLHTVMRGVYAVGRPELTEHGRWMAAVLRVGSGAVLSHETAAVAWGIRPSSGKPIEVSVPEHRSVSAPGIRVHRRTRLTSREVSRLHGIPLTSPAQTLVDLAARLPTGQLEAAINAADKRDLIAPDELRAKLETFAGQPGVAILRRLLDRHSFVLTDSELERRFLPIAREAGLPPPLTGQSLNGYRVDFYWPDLGLVVETDGLRYHRTPTQQVRDRRRDQAHARAGLATLRFTHAQVSYEPGHVRETLAAVAARLAGERDA